CHSTGTPMRLQALQPGATTWNEEDSRKNFDIVRSIAVPGDPLKSKLLLHPLVEAAGGDPIHDGGKHWKTQDDPDWQTLAPSVRGKTLAGVKSPAPAKVRIIQTNSAGDDVHIIDPVTNKVV